MPTRSRRAILRGGLALAVPGLLSACGVPLWQTTPAIPRVGFLSPDVSTGDEAAPLAQAFREGLRELGYVEGENILIEYRWAEGTTSRLPDLATELIQVPVQVIVATGPLASRAARDRSTTTPVVMAPVADPIETGLVAGLARPGGNVTGLTSLAQQLVPKRLELLKQAVPRVARVGVLWNPDVPARAGDFREVQSAGQSLRLEIVSLEVRRVEDFDGAFATAVSHRVDALLWFADVLTASHLPRILKFLSSEQLPATSDSPRATAAGALMSYGADRADLARRAATYVDKILRGAKPSELPVEQPTKFELVVNLKAAQTLGLSIPSSVLEQATDIIQ